jgi:hypothetical protein
MTFNAAKRTFPFAEVYLKSQKNPCFRKKQGFENNYQYLAVEATVTIIPSRYILETIHTARNGNLLPRDPRGIIGSQKYGCFCNVLGLASATKRRVGNKHFFIVTASSYTRTAAAPSVSVAPGKIELIRMFCTPSSFDKEIVMASNAALVAEYKEAPGSGILLAPELILMTFPPLSPNSFKAACIVSMGPSTLTLKLL